MKHADKSNIGKSSILKWLAYGCAAVVLAATAAAGIYLHYDDQTTQSEVVADGQIDTAKTEAVINEKAAARLFLNQPAPAPEPGDNRQVFRIIEVIPHDACSVFPYMIDWGSNSEFEKNVPIGYEGILLAGEYGGSTFDMFSEPNVKAGSSKPFTFKKGDIVRDYLTNYEIEFTASSNSKGKWYRKTDREGDVKNELQGYFEYVGPGKGLYYINVSKIAQRQAEKGVHYEMQAIPRKGTEAPKGEMYIEDASYYWPVNYESSAKPTYNGRTVQSQTAYNYTLAFLQMDTGEYIADTAAIQRDLAGGEGYDYALLVDPEQWDYGFTFDKGGAFIVKEAKEENTGKYVRFGSEEQGDGFASDTLQDLEKGYFIYDPKQEYFGVKRYEISFSEAVSGKGFYRAAEPDVWLNHDYLFTYMGEGEGIYDVPFLYASDADKIDKTLYDASIVKVTNNQGNYALTSTAVDANGKPVYGKGSVSGQNNDYAEVVTNIDFSNEINQAKADVDRIPGVSLGGGEDSVPEYGGWIFIPVTDATEMKQTFLSKVKKNTNNINSNTDTYFSRGDRIYVYNQARRYRYYCRDGFYNNEWFKLLCYSNNPRDKDKPYSQMVDGVGYDMNKTSAENLSNETTKQILSAFNSTFRIEVIQRTPDKLTVGEVRSADLIYFGMEAGIQGIFQLWNNISAEREKAGLEPLAPLDSGAANGGKIKYQGDLNGDVLMAIYDECIYKQNTAIMFSQNCFPQSSSTSWGNSAANNIDKLFHFLAWYKEALTWSYFMPTYIQTEDASHWYNVDYSRIYPDSSASVCKTSKQIESNSKEHYNWEYREADAFYIGQNGTWLTDYFKVRKIPEVHDSVYPFNDNNHAFTGKVLEGESKFILGEYVIGSFMSANQHYNIWQILKNRKKDTSVLTIEIINAEQTAELPAVKVIYADEFAPESFDVICKPIVLGATNRTPELQSITVTFEDGTVLDNIGSPVYDAEYSTNVRKGFANGGSADPNALLDPNISRKKVIATVTDRNGRTASDEAWVIVREAFNLN